MGVSKTWEYKGYAIERTWPSGMFRVQRAPDGLPFMADTLGGLKQAIDDMKQHKMWRF